jgi:hypothetical protein
MKIKLIDLILIIFFTGLIIYGIVSIKMINSESAKCVSSPLEYGVKLYSEALNTTTYCSCFFSDKRYKPIIVTSNKTKILEESK